MKEGKTIKWQEIEPEIINTTEVKGVKKRIVIGEKEGASNFILRVFTLSPGGYSPRHTHSWEHEVFVLNGEGKVLLGQEFSSISKGYAVFVPENVEHQFVNTSESNELEFICVIPKGGQ
ncbi:MAG TPA: cupin domain-containing protein [Bacteroidales bacterium]|nr:cupin domain-containing protein [Bacteroidales bacterium]HRW33517.1 cupin domain-containing protein [Thermotogota bacterium]